MDPTDQDAAIQEFVKVTGATPQRARGFLIISDWDVQAALAEYFQAMEASDDGTDEEEVTAQTSAPAQASGARGMGGRRLGDDSEPAAATAATPSTASAQPVRRPAPKQQPQKKFGSLADFQSGGSGGAGHDDDDSEKEQEFYTGGDKSGLAVQDPKMPQDHIKRLMETARRNGPRPSRPDGGDDDESARPSSFRGPGQTLGGDDVESRFVPAEHPNGQGRPTEMVERTLHMWSDGFSVDDGPLYRYDDPANVRTLDMINSGSAPLDIMNVEPGQAVDVKIDNRREENYKKPKEKFKPFAGTGQRLGSPTPGPSGFGSATSAPTSSAPPAQADSTSKPDLDESQPTITLQIRLADGTRLPSRFNTTHTVGDVYAFVNRANPGSTERAYTLASTFPTKDLADKAQVLGEMPEFKRGGVVVQKWS